MQSTAPQVRKAPPNLPALPPGEVYSALRSSPLGITDDEATVRLRVYGPNVIEEIAKTPLIFRFLSQFTHFFAILLWVATGLAFVSGTPELGWAILAVIVINAVFSFWQEYKAEKATEALKRLIPALARVMRDGEERMHPAAELVPGDLVVLAEGDNISADARVVQQFELRTVEATLTGESLPVRKTADPIYREGMAWTEIPNLVFAGTSVASGSGRAVVFATGMSTEFGKVAQLTQGVEEEPSPLMIEMSQVTKIVAGLAIGMGILFFVLGSFVAGLTLAGAFLFAIGIIVANVPEGLLPTVTLSLAMAVQEMAKRNALVKKLAAVETLGSTNVICTDKTGTLTQNEMTVRNIWVSGRNVEVEGVGYNPRGSFRADGTEVAVSEVPYLSLLLTCAGFCNNARLNPPSDGRRDWSILGDPTEGALLVAAAKGGFDFREEYLRHPRVYELPFDSVRKRMTAVHPDTRVLRAYVKGAPREVLALCRSIALQSGLTELTPETREMVMEKNDSYARQGLRVLALAYRDLPATETRFSIEETEQDLVFLGLAAMMDPPRPEVANAVDLCYDAGIRVYMITGDYGLTAESVAKRIGLIRKGQARIITGSDLDAMTDPELGSILSGEEPIFARVNPQHKMRIVSVLREQNKLVAVTGDGVNDAPALKRADIGISMGITGTDVAKEASEMILLDDNFATIVSAIEEGRAVYDNIKKFVTYIFASNIPEIVPFILFVMTGIPLPLTIIQILAVDLGTDLVPALALGTERPEPGVMRRQPRPREKRLLDRALLARAYGFLGIIEAIAAMSAYFWTYYIHGWRPGDVLIGTGDLYREATTMTLAAIVATQVGNAFAVRTERESVFRIGLFSNRFLLVGIASELALIMLVVYFPPLQAVFGTAPLSLGEWAFVFMFTPVILFAEELRKWIIRRRSPSSD